MNLTTMLLKKNQDHFNLLGTWPLVLGWFVLSEKLISFGDQNK